MRDGRVESSVSQLSLWVIRILLKMIDAENKFWGLK